MENTIDLWPIVGPLLGVIGSIAAGVIAALAARALKAVGLQVDAKHREVLQDSLERAVSFGAKKVGARAQSLSKVEVEREVIAAATNYVLARTPDALRHFGVTEASLGEMIEARLGEWIGDVEIDSFEPPQVRTSGETQVG